MERGRPPSYEDQTSAGSYNQPKGQAVGNEKKKIAWSVLQKSNSEPTLIWKVPHMESCGLRVLLCVCMYSLTHSLPLHAGLIPSSSSSSSSSSSTLLCPHHSVWPLLLLPVFRLSHLVSPQSIHPLQAWQYLSPPECPSLLLFLLSDCFPCNIALLHQWTRDWCWTRVKKKRKKKRRYCSVRGAGAAEVARAWLHPSW